MANRNNIHIVQRPSGWGTLREGSGRVSNLFRTQEQAIRSGTSMAREGKGELVIHGQDGRIRERNSYGNDPYPPKG